MDESPGTVQDDSFCFSVADHATLITRRIDVRDPPLRIRLKILPPAAAISCMVFQVLVVVFAFVADERWGYAPALSHLGANQPADAVFGAGVTVGAICIAGTIWATSIVNTALSSVVFHTFPGKMAKFRRKWRWAKHSGMYACIFQSLQGWFPMGYAVMTHTTLAYIMGLFLIMFLSNSYYAQRQLLAGFMKNEQWFRTLDPTPSSEIGRYFSFSRQINDIKMGLKYKRVMLWCCSIMSAIYFPLQIGQENLHWWNTGLDTRSIFGITEFLFMLFVEIYILSFAYEVNQFSLGLSPQVPLIVRETVYPTMHAPIVPGEAKQPLQSIA